MHRPYILQSQGNVAQFVDVNAADFKTFSAALEYDTAGLARDLAKH
jgi:hypothetical protein